MRMFKETGVEWIGKIPRDWEVVILKKCCDLCKGLPITKADLIKNGTPVISYGQIHSKNNKWTVISKDLIRYVDNSYKFSNPFALAQVGSIIFADTSEDYEGIGNCIYVNLEQGIFAGYHTIIVRPFNIYYPKYLAFLFQTDCWRSQLRSSASGIKVFSVTQKMLRNTTLIVPPNTKQQRIADYLDSKCSKIDSIIEKQQAVIEKLKEYKLSVITEAVTKGLNPDVEMKDSGVEWIDKVPKHWKIVKLDDIFDFLGGYAYNSDLYVSESLNQVVRIGNVKNGFLKLDASPVYINDEVAEETSKFKLSSGTILFTMTGTKGKRDYFYTHLITDKDLMEKSLYINQRVGGLISKTDLNAGYFNYLLKDKSILDSIFVYETGTANQGNLGMESIRRTKLQFPSREEQDAIVSYLDKKCLAIDSNIAKKQSIISKLLEYKKSLIYEVVTGKKEV